MIELVYKTRPRPYQKGAVLEALKSRNLNMMLNADPGLGKTKMSIDIAQSLYRADEITDVWIIAPNSVHRQWIDEQIGIHCAVDYIGLAYKASKWNQKNYQKKIDEYKLATGKLRFFSINVETFAIQSGLDRMREMWKNVKGKIMLVIDESSRFKNPSAKRFKPVQGLAQRAAYVTTLTGTPINNSPFDLWGQYELLRKDFFDLNFYSFKHRYGLMIKQQGGGRTFTSEAGEKNFRYLRSLISKGLDDELIAERTGFRASAVRWLRANPDHNTPYRNLDELKEKVSPHTIQLRKEDVAKDLPEKIFAPLYTELTPEQKKAYRELVKHYGTEYEGEECTLNHAMTLTMRLQQITGGFFPTTDPDDPSTKWIPFKKNPKLDLLLEDLEDMPRGSIIVWAEFRAEIEAIVAAILKKFPDWTVRTYYGGTKDSERSETIAKFQTGLVDVLVAHRQSAGVGLNLQRSNIQYYFSNGFSYEDRKQAEDRIHRIGQKSKTVLYKDLCIKGTVDDKIKSKFLERKELAEDFRNMKEFIQFED